MRIGPDNSPMDYPMAALRCAAIGGIDSNFTDIE
jgi:hypothetical protein